MTNTRKGLLEIQRCQLDEWKLMLKEEVFLKLESLVIKSNNSLRDDKEDDWKVVRGVNIEMILQNEVKPFFLIRENKL